MKRLLIRLAVIGHKAIKLCGLLLLVRCLGPENAMALLGCGACLRERAVSVMANVIRFVLLLAALIWWLYWKRCKVTETSTSRKN